MADKPYTPGLNHPNIRHLVPSQVDDVLRNVYDNLVYLRNQVTKAPQSVGSALPNTTTVNKQVTAVGGSSGGGGSISLSNTIVDTHAIRLITYASPLPAIGTTFYEYDRNAFYIVTRRLDGTVVWELIIGVFSAPIGNRPTDLGIDDNGFMFVDSATNDYYMWNGTAWVTLGSVFLPTKLDNLVLWLRSDLGVTYDGSNRVSQWDDQSPSALSFVQAVNANKPIYTTSYINSLPAIVFTAASSQYMTATGLGTVLAGDNKPHCIFIVCKATVTGTPFSSNSNAGVGSPHIQITWDAANTWWYEAIRIAIGNPSFTGKFGLAESASSAEHFCICFYTSKTTALEMSARESGRTVLDRLYGSVGAAAMDHMVLGALGDNGFAALSQYLDGAIEEIIIYSSPPAEEDLQRVEQYLISRYGLVGYRGHTIDALTPFVNFRSVVRSAVGASYYLSEHDFHVYVNPDTADIDIYLPAFLGPGGGEFTITRSTVASAYNVIVRASGGFIQGNTTYILTNKFQSVTFQSSGTADYIIKSVYPTHLWGTYANRPAVTANNNEQLYYATDQNVLYTVEAGVWVYLSGIMLDTLTPDNRPSLAAGDYGFLFWATDDLQLFIWDGSVWNNVGIPTPPGDPYQFLNGDTIPAFTYPLLHYGSMYDDDTVQTVSIGATDTYVDIPGSLSDGGSTAAFTIQSSYQLKCNIAGTYLANWSVTGTIAGANESISGAVGVNGSYQPNTTNHGHISTATDECSIGGTGIIALAVNDVVTVMIANHTSTSDVDVSHVNLTLIKLA